MARPDLKISLKLKDGNGERIYPAAAWKSDRGMGYNLKLDEGWSIVAPDGTKYTTGRDGNCYADVFEERNREDNGGGGGKPKTSYGDFGGDDFDDGSGIPF